jgi:tripartite-type tricarboxylate transporter receptor subunit TctC
MYALNPSLYDNLAYDPIRDLVPVTLIATYDFVLVVNPQVLPVKTVADIIALAKASPAGLNYASPGNQSTHRLAMELFASEANINLVPIPYKGGAPALQDLLAGQVGMMFLDRVSAMSNIEAGKLRLIAAAGQRRIPAYPNTPTIAESGIKDFNVDAWLALTMRSGTPDEVVKAVHDAYVKAIVDKEMRDKLAATGINAFSSTPEEFGRFLHAETTRWARVVRERNIKPG